MKDNLLAALLFVLFLLALFSIPSHAQDLPQAPSMKLYWTETAAFTVSNVIDGWSTVKLMHNNLYIEQPFPNGSSFMLGKHPRAARYTLVMGGCQLLTQYAAWKLERSHSRLFRLVGHGLMLDITEGHLQGFIVNVNQHTARVNPPQPYLFGAIK